MNRTPDIKIPDYLFKSSKRKNFSSQSSTSKAINTTGNKPDTNVLEKQIKSLKKERKALNKTIGDLKIIILILILLLGVSVSVFTYKYIQLKNKYDNLVEQNNESISKIISIENDMSDLSKVLDSESDLLLKTSQIAVSLDKELSQLKTDNLALQEENVTLSNQINDLSKRKELFDKYENAIINSTGTRTDITYDDLKMLENLTGNMNMTQDSVNLILSLAMAESDGNQNAKNPKSTATGLGQFLSGTGQFVYTKLMKGSGYNHSTTAKDHTTNLKMMVYYLDYLDKNHSSITGVIDEYRGFHDPAYINKIDRILKKYDSSLSLASVKIHK